RRRQRRPRPRTRVLAAGRAPARRERRRSMVPLRTDDPGGFGCGQHERLLVAAREGDLLQPLQRLVPGWAAVAGLRERAALAGRAAGPAEPRLALRRTDGPGGLPVRAALLALL